MKKTTQEDPMGCGIACVATITNLSYTKAKNLFEKPEKASTKGYYCKEIVNALKKAGKNYVYKKHNKEKFSRGEIVFIERSKKYPLGHYLVKTNKGWMNPWVNYPNINPARSEFQKKLPGKPQWVIIPIQTQQ